MSIVLMVILGLLEGRQGMKAMYKYATTMLGAQYVMIIGTLMMLMLSAVSLDYYLLVFALLLS